MAKILEYGYVAWTYVQGPFSAVVAFVAARPKTSVAIFIASHALRSVF
jgi:hypothetical protein